MINRSSRSIICLDAWARWNRLQSKLTKIVITSVSFRFSLPLVHDVWENKFSVQVSIWEGQLKMLNHCLNASIIAIAKVTVYRFGIKNRSNYANWNIHCRQFEIFIKKVQSIISYYSYSNKSYLMISFYFRDGKLSSFNVWRFSQNKLLLWS